MNVPIPFTFSKRRIIIFFAVIKDWKALIALCMAVLLLFRYLRESCFFFFHCSLDFSVFFLAISMSKRCDTKTSNPLCISAAVFGTLPVLITWLKYTLNSAVYSKGLVPPSKSRKDLPLVIPILALRMFCFTCTFSVVLSVATPPTFSKLDDSTATSLTPCKCDTSTPNDADIFSTLSPV